MIGDEELDALLTTLGGQFDDAELDRRVAGFRSSLRRLRADRAEATRIDALAADPGIDLSLAAMVARATEGDPAAWEEIVDRYGPLVWSICRRFQLSGHDVEDVAQNVWLLTVEHLGRLREPAALPGWLATTTRRECLRVVTTPGRSGRAAAELDDVLKVADTAIEEAILVAERNAVWRAALADLPPGCQQLLAMLMADPPGSYAEISAALNIPVGSIGPQRARCLQRLRRYEAIMALGRGDEPGPAR